jgi:hypothetical protein
VVCSSDTLEVLTGKLQSAAGLILGVAELSFVRTVTTVIIMITHPALQERDIHCIVLPKFTQKLQSIMKIY